MGYVVCLEYSKSFKSVNLKLKKEDEKGYDYSMLVLYTLETDKGFKVKKIGKTTKKGTKVTYEHFKSDNDVSDYLDLLKVKKEEFSEKWNINLKVEKE